MSKPDGHRYIRAYLASGGVWRWALWTVERGRARRVGTAYVIDDAYAHIGCLPPIPFSVAFDDETRAQKRNAS